MTRRQMREQRQREARARAALLLGARAPVWLGPAIVLSAVAAVALLAAGCDICAPVAWAAVGATGGLLAAMTMVAIVLPLSLRRANLFAWLLSGLVTVALASAGVLTVIDRTI